MKKDFNKFSNASVADKSIGDNVSGLLPFKIGNVLGGADSRQCVLGFRGFGI